MVSKPCSYAGYRTEGLIPQARRIPQAPSAASYIPLLPQTSLRQARDRGFGMEQARLPQIRPQRRRDRMAQQREVGVELVGIARPRDVSPRERS